MMVQQPMKIVFAAAYVKAVVGMGETGAGTLANWIQCRRTDGHRKSAPDMYAGGEQYRTVCTNCEMIGVTLIIGSILFIPFHQHSSTSLPPLQLVVLPLLHPFVFLCCRYLIYQWSIAAFSVCYTTLTLFVFFLGIRTLSSGKGLRDGCWLKDLGLMASDCWGSRCLHTIRCIAAVNQQALVHPKDPMQ